MSINHRLWAAELFSLRCWTSLTRALGQRSGGARRDRTDDLLLAKQALSQLSYGPVSTLRPPFQACDLIERPAHRIALVGLERFELSTSRLSSARSNQLSYRPGKRGGRPKRRKRNEDGGVPQRELEAGASQAPCVSKHRERAKPRWLLTSVFLASLERR